MTRTPTHQTHQRARGLSIGLVAAIAVISGAVHAASPTHAAGPDHKDVGTTKVATPNDAIPRWFQNVTFNNNTNTPLHIQAAVNIGGHRSVTVEVGKSAEIPSERLLALEVFAGRDVNAPLWAEYSNLGTYLDNSPSRTGYVWAQGKITDPDTNATKPFKVTTGSSESLELGRKTFSTKFSQETTSHGWIPRAELTFRGGFEAAFPDDSIVTVKNRTHQKYTFDGQPINRMEEASKPIATPRSMAYVASIKPVEASPKTYPATDVGLSVPALRTQPSQLMLTDSHTDAKYFTADGLWGTQGTALGRSEPKHGVTMTVWRAQNINGQAHFVITIYNI
jgi:hypothetical protein